ncbi:helix-turn-helix domain-containing protein [Gaetbulibacter jejuensis]|uniref:Helix-turn-helix domain-containing protein n=1 Tax=Gaetbulibacter jejuensis TaxID=584607 RepID=A0ABP3V9C6_9FLAO
MTDHVIQLEKVSKKEFFERIENIIDEKLSILIKVDKDEKLSVKEVAEELGLAELTIRNYIKKGILPAVKIGRRVFVIKKDLDSTLQEVKSLKYRRD